MQHLLLLVAVVVIAGAIFDAIGGALERASRDRQHGRFVAEARQEHAKLLALSLEELRERLADVGRYRSSEFDGQRRAKLERAINEKLLAGK